MTDKEIRDRVSKSFVKIFPGLEVFEDDLSPSKLNEWDSLKHIMLVTEIEKDFQIRFGLDDMLEMKSFGDICKAVAALVDK